jgi:hypothetical protein
MSKYSASFTVGAHLLEEMDVFVPLLLAKDNKGIDDVIKNGGDLKINSEVARLKKFQEIRFRFEKVDEEVWEKYLLLEAVAAKHLVLYYVILEAHPLIQAFHLEIVLEKWQSASLKLSKDDFFNLLNKKRPTHPEIDEWSDSTQNKIASTALLMLKEAGLSVKNKLQKVVVADDVAEFFGKRGEWWFLEAIFMTKEEMREVAKKNRK